jgi:hypothetical protein
VETNTYVIMQTRSHTQTHCDCVSRSFQRLADDGDWEVKRRFIALCHAALQHGDTLASVDPAALLITLLDDSARLVRRDAARALIDVARTYTDTSINRAEAQQFLARVAHLSLDARVAADVVESAWDTDFDGLDDPTQSLTLSDSDASSDDGGDVPLDCD